MAIVQISKIQQRSGNLVDLPQLDDAELGWANDARRLFIGKTTPNENVEILTSYSAISFSQIDGAVGNLNISNLTAANGQVLSFDGSDWVNRGGDAGGLLTLGDVGNVKIDGGAIGYVLQTDGTGNLSWTPKGTLVTSILNISKANPAVVTSVNDNFFANAAQITILDPQGMTELAGGIYFAEPLTSTTFALYTDSGLSTGANSTSYNAYSYTTVSATTVSTNVITVANSSPFTVGAAVKFIGNMSTSNISNTATYYVQAKPNSTSLKIATSEDANAANVVPLQTTSGLTAEVYQSDGQAVSTLGSSVTFSPAGGTNTTVQFNSNGSLDGSAAFVFNSGSGLLTLTGNANVGNLNATGVATASRFLSNVGNGTPPLQVTSFTRVANLSVAYSNVSDFGVVTTQTTGTFYPVFVSGNSTANYALASNANISVNAATGNLSVTLLNVTSNANVGNLGTAGLITATGNVSGGNLTTAGALSVTGNANVGNIGAVNGVFTGNITAGNIIGTVVGGSNPVTTTGNITGGNIIGTIAAGANTISTTGNVTAGNLYANSGTLGVATLNVSGESNLNSVGNVYISGGNANQLLQTDGAGNLSWTDPNGGYFLHTQSSANTTWTVTHNLNRQYVTVEAIDANGNSYTGRYDYPTISYTNANALTMTFTSAVAGYAAVTGGGTNINSVSVGNSTPGGVNTQVQFNDAGALAGSSGLVYDKTTGTLTATLYAGSGANLTNIAGANVTGAVAFATTANAVAGANISGAVSFATTANAVAGANVTGAVAFATTANAVAGANVSGAVSFATTANAVAGANVSGTVSAATTAGTVTTAAQPNITSVGTLTSLGVSGALTTTQITAGANTTAGNITGNWTLTTGSRLTATYADLAEYYEADVKYLPGTVLMFGGEKEVTLADDGTNKVAGVVSTNPAYVMNATCPGLLTAVALQGRVPCKVRGKISKGDMLISGGNGFARPNQFPAMGTVIGKALQDFDGYEGVIEVAVGRL